MSDGPLPRSVHGIRDAVAKRRVRARDVVAAALDRIAARDAEVRAFLHVDGDRALRRAEKIDRRVAEGRTQGRLLGVPIAVKDNICVRHMPATAGSRILEGYEPPFHAHAVKRMLDEGAVVIGKTNLDEFGMGSSTEHSAYMTTRNPHDLERVPGGSSGGSAAAVAAGMVPVALGSDTGGSIRQPAALCGVVGFKPTYGTVSRRGLIAFASSLDQIGPIGATVLDVACVQSVIAGHDALDSTARDLDHQDYAATLSKDLEGVRVGVHPELTRAIADAEAKSAMDRAVDTLREQGARIVPLDDLDLMTRHAIACYYILATSEASSNLARFDGIRYGPREPAPDLAACYRATRGRRFGPEVQRRILLGTFALSAGYYDAWYARAADARRRIRAMYARAFGRVDVIISATTPGPAFPIGESVEDPLTMDQRDLLTIPASLAGSPAASVPCGYTAGGLPLGLQVVGKPGDDATVLSFAFAWEQVSGCKGRLAKIGTGEDE